MTAHKIALGDLGEFWYGDYKEPFVQLEGAVPGYPLGVLLKDDDGRPVCAYCGKPWDNLGKHAHDTHGMSAREYKAETGLLQKSALVSEKTRQRMIAQALRNGNRPPESFASGRDRSTDRRGKHTAEHLNMTGRCLEQTLNVARQILRDKGKLSWRAFGEYGIRQGTINRYFGSLNELRARLDQPRGPAKWSDRDMLDSLRRLAAELGHTPAVSDIRRYGLPSQSLYTNHFGSYAEACRQAGLDPNLPRPLTGELAVAVLTAYASGMSMGDIARRVGIAVPRVKDILTSHGVATPNPFHAAARAEARSWAGELARRIAA